MTRIRAFVPADGDRLRSLWTEGGFRLIADDDAGLARFATRSLGKLLEHDGRPCAWVRPLSGVGGAIASGRSARRARRERRSRSEVYSAALREYVARHSPDEVTDALDRVVADVGDTIDPFVGLAAARILESTEW